MVVLETEELTYRYGVSTPLEQVTVDNINISIRRDESLGVIGHTDSGKSMLIQQLNGLIRPTSGQVLSSGNGIWAEPKKVHVVRFQIELVFRYPEYRLFEETALRDICFGPRNMGLSEEEIKEHALGTAEFVDLKTELLEESSLELSGDEKRHAAVAGVVAMDPEVSVLDKPAAGLDPQGRDQLLNQIRSHRQRRGDTMLLISRSMGGIAHVTDHALVMNRGKAAMLSTVQQVFSRRGELENMGLRVSQVTKIMSLPCAKGYPVNKGALTVNEALRDLSPLLRERGCVQ